MRRILTGIALLCSIVLLSGCEKVPITEGIIDVVYENIHYEGDSIIVEIWITNGTDEAVDIGYVDFWFEFPDQINLTELGVDEFCGAGFPIYETINSQKYKSYELEFTSEYIFVTKAEFTDLGIELADLILYFNIE